MRRQVLFVQGGGAGTHDEWDDKLVASLTRELGPDFEIRYPRMPNEDEPEYDPWRKALAKELATLDDGAILVGHSIGGTILIKALSEQPPPHRIGAIVLLSAPFVGEGGWPSDDVQIPIDLDARLPGGVPVHIYQGLDDETTPPSHAQLFARAMPRAHVHLLPDRDHQLNNDLSDVAATITTNRRRP